MGVVSLLAGDLVTAAETLAAAFHSLTNGTISPTDAVGLAARVQGLERYYALRLAPGANERLHRALDQLLERRVQRDVRQL